MAPPAKKQRRLVLSSDDEPSQAGDILAADRTAGFGGPSRNTRTRNSRSKAIENGKSKPSATAKRKGSLSSTPTSSPEKKRSRKDVEEAVKSKSLHSFFSKVTEEQRWKKKEPQEEDEQIEEQLEDIDDDSDDAIFNSLTRNENATLPLDRWKASARSNGTNFQEHRASSTNKIGPKPLTGVLSAQKFATGSTHEGISGKEVYFPGQEEDRRTWADRYAPQSLEELGIHKKKVADVKAWLADAFSHPHRRVRIFDYVQMDIPLLTSDSIFLYSRDLPAAARPRPYPCWPRPWTYSLWNGRTPRPLKVVHLRHLSPTLMTFSVEAVILEVLMSRGRQK